MKPRSARQRTQLVALTFCNDFIPFVAKSKRLAGQLPHERWAGRLATAYLEGMPYLRRRMAMAVCEVRRRVASRRLDG